MNAKQKLGFSGTQSLNDLSLDSKACLFYLIETSDFKSSEEVHAQIVKEENPIAVVSEAFVLKVLTDISLLLDPNDPNKKKLDGRTVGAFALVSHLCVKLLAAVSIPKRDMKKVIWNLPEFMDELVTSPPEGLVKSVSAKLEADAPAEASAPAKGPKADLTLAGASVPVAVKPSKPARPSRAETLEKTLKVVLKRVKQSSERAELSRMLSEAVERFAPSCVERLFEVAVCIFAERALGNVYKTSPSSRAHFCVYLFSSLRKSELEAILKRRAFDIQFLLGLSTEDGWEQEILDLWRLAKSMDKASRPPESVLPLLEKEKVADEVAPAEEEAFDDEAFFAELRAENDAFFNELFAENEAFYRKQEQEAAREEAKAIFDQVSENDPLANPVAAS